MTTLAWLILWIPFGVSVIITLFLLSRPKAAALLATAGMFITLGLACLITARVDLHTLAHEPLESAITWIQLENAPIQIGVLLNGLTILMLLIVTGVGSLIFLYSISYMRHEKSVGRYFASLSLFSFSMLGIVLSNNIIQVFIFWELVGVSSYLLIGFWQEKESAGIASKKAFLTNRVGDIGMMIGILFLFHLLSEKGLGTFNFLLLEKALPQANFDPSILTTLCLLIFCGVAGKSAQVPLHVWLPDAMEGPTPVSALMHAATMVAAGVFLLARFFFMFELSPTALHFISWVGIFTALLAGTMAVVQNDIKKVLAYSTLSQLGYMVMALGLGSPEAGMFHLTTHAFFKALLFLGAGSLIHGMHTQDIWEMSHHSNLLKKMPVTSLTFILGALALMGIPPLSGYFSKEEILSAASGGPTLLFIASLAVVLLTAFYMGRLCTLLFLGSKEKETSHHHEVRESDWLILIPLVLLAVLSVVGGYLPLKDFLATGHAEHHGPSWLGLGSVLIAAFGFISAFFVFRNRHHAGPIETKFPGVVLDRKYFFDDVYDALIKNVQENIATFSDAFERHAVVQWMANGTAAAARSVGKTVTQMQTGMIQFYGFVFASGVTLFAIILIFLRR